VKESEAAAPWESSIAEVAKILLLWGADPVVSFCRVEFVDEEARKQVVDRLRSGLAEKTVPFAEIDLPNVAEPGERVLQLVELLRAQPPGVVSLNGLGAAFPFHDDLAPFLQALNFQREHLALRGLRQIWWMPVHIGEAFSRQIPDLDSWFQVRLALEEIAPKAASQDVLLIVEVEVPGPIEARALLAEAKARVAKAAEKGRLQPSEAGQMLDVALLNLRKSGAQAEADEEEAKLREQFPEIWNISAAEERMHQALESDEASFGKDHPNVAIRLSNLAQLFQVTDRLGEAELLIRRALEIDQTSFGKNHPNVARDFGNLGLLLLATNRIGEAEPLLRRALEIDEAGFGKGHPNIAIRLTNLAQLLLVTNRFGEAEPLMRRALEIDEANFGKEHPNIARDLNNLAALLQATNRFAEAEPLMRRALAIFETSLGDGHPSTVTARENLALVLADSASAVDKPAKGT